MLAPNAARIGASAAVFGVVLGFAMFWPHDKIFIYGVIPVEAWTLVILTTLFSLYAGFPGANSGVADFAHLGGYAGAWVFAPSGTRAICSRCRPNRCIT